MADKGNWIALAWLVISLFTFAWSASDPAQRCVERTIYDHCAPQAFYRVTSGLAAGTFWPLYWAWTGAEALREATNHD